MSYNTAKCKACGADIMFLKTQKGKTMPVNATSKYIVQDPAGIPFVLPDGSVVMAKEVECASYEEATGAGYQIGYTSHFATCTQPDKFRKPRKSDRKKG